MIINFSSRTLERAFRGDTRRLTPNLVPRITGVLAVLNAAQSIEDIEPLTGFHNLVGNRVGTCAVTITRNHRITFMPVTIDWQNPLTNQTAPTFGVKDVDFEDYH